MGNDKKIPPPPPDDEVVVSNAIPPPPPDDDEPVKKKVGTGTVLAETSGVLRSEKIPDAGEEFSQSLLKPSLGTSQSESPSPSGDKLPTLYKKQFTDPTSEGYVGEIDIDGKRTKVDKGTFDKYEQVEEMPKYEEPTQQRKERVALITDKATQLFDSKPELFKDPANRDKLYTALEKKYTPQEVSQVKEALSDTEEKRTSFVSEIIGDNYERAQEYRIQKAHVLSLTQGEAMKERALDDPLIFLAYATIEGVKGGVTKVSESVETGKKEGVASGILQGVVGAGETALSAMIPFVPPLAAFTLVAAGVEETMPEAGAVLAPIMKTLDNSVYKDKEKPKWVENLAIVGDFAWNILLFAGAHKLSAKVKAGEKLTAEEAKEVQSIIEKVTPEQAEKVAQPLVEQNELTQKEKQITALETDIANNPVVAENLKIKLDEVKKEHGELQDKITTNDAIMAEKEMQVNTYNEAIAALESKKGGLSEDGVKALDEQIDLFKNKIKDIVGKPYPKETAPVQEPPPVQESRTEAKVEQSVENPSAEVGKAEPIKRQETPLAAETTSEKVEPAKGAEKQPLSEKEAKEPTKETPKAEGVTEVAPEVKQPTATTEKKELTPEEVRVQGVMGTKKGEPAKAEPEKKAKEEKAPAEKKPESKTITEAGEQTERLEGLIGKGEPKVKESLKKIADEIRKGKIEDDLMFSGIPFAKEVWNGAVEVAAKTFEVTGNIAQAIAEGIKHIKGTKWYNNLTDAQKKRAEEKFQNEQDRKLKKAQQGQLPPPELEDLSKKFVEEFDKKIEEKKKLKWNRIIPFINEKFFDTKGRAKSILEKAGAIEAIWKKNLTLGASAAAKQRFEEAHKEIFGTLFKNKLTKEEKSNLNTLILSRRTAELDAMKDKMRQEKFDLQNELSTTIDETRANEIKDRLDELERRGTERIKHTRLVIDGKEVFLTKELAESWIEGLKKDNPDLYEKLNARADKYFATNRELLHERLNAGVIDKETFYRLINFDYSKRMFIEKMMDSELLQKGGFLSSEIKAIKEGSEDLLFNDAEFLLQQNIASTTRLVFETDANKSLYEFAEKEKPDFIKTQESIGVNKETGQPTYPDAPDGWQQVQFKKDGKLKSMIVPTEFYKSWAVKDPLIKSSIANAIQWLTLTKPLKIMATGINQYFPMYNILRDIGHTYFFTDNYSPVLPKAIGQMGVDFWKVGRDVLLRRGKVKDYIKEGGGMDFLTTQGKPVTSFGKSEAGQAAELLYDAASYLSGTSELMVRVAVRERNIKDLTDKFVKDNGRNPSHTELWEIQKESTEAARQTMDFGSGGEWVKAADNFFPYLNAAFQGLRVAGRAFRQRPGDTALRVSQGIGLVVAGTLYNLKYDEEDEKNGVLGYNAIPAYQKATGMVIMMPYTTTNLDGDAVRPYVFIPMPQEFSPFKTVTESMTELMKTGRFNGRPLKRGFLHAIPYKDLRDIPAAEMLYSYDNNYDRFRDKKIWVGDNVKPSDEFYKGRTPEMYQDWGKITGMSPERTKTAMGKVLTDQESNIYTQAISAGYDKVKDALSDDKERKEFNDMVAKNVEGKMNPLQKKFYKYPNKKELEKELLERAEQEQNSKRKIEEKDKVREFMLKYKNAETEGEKAKIKQEVREYALKTGKKTPGATERILNSFNAKLKIGKIKNDIIVDLSFMDSPEAAARVYHEIWKEATPEKRKSLEADLKSMGVNTPRFNVTIKNLSKGKINVDETPASPWKYQKK